MICKFCGVKMTLDDVDKNFTGNQNNYWLCYHCGTSCFELIRYGISISREFTKGEILCEMKGEKENDKL